MCNFTKKAPYFVIKELLIQNSVPTICYNLFIENIFEDH